jgi:hypothetical protein
MWCIKIGLIVVGLAASSFYAWKAVEIFTDTNDPYIQKKNNLRSWRLHQRWLNFVGSLAGWAAAYYHMFWRVLPSALMLKAGIAT